VLRPAARCHDPVAEFGIEAGDKWRNQAPSCQIVCNEQRATQGNAYAVYRGLNEWDRVVKSRPARCV
jgi:hypothetical protein